MTRLTTAEMPKTRAEFLSKWKNDHVFRARALNMGFNVIMDNVIFPDGQVAGAKVK